jgi:DNA-binding SARP family transcriptional activator
MVDVLFGVLGRVVVAVDGQEVRIGGSRQRAVLAVLLLEHGQVVSVDRLIWTVWGQEPGDGSRNLLQVGISGLRRSVAPVAEAMGSEPLIVTRSPGYAIELPAECVDSWRFGRGTREARERVRAGDSERAAVLLRESLDLWRGPALSDLTDEPALATLAVQLDEARLVAEGDWIEVELTLGRHGAALPRAIELVERYPTDERLRGLLMLALYRSGRQADALAAYQAGRNLLIEELGIEPGAGLRELESLILRHAAELELDRRPSHEPSTVIAASSILVPRAVLVVGGRRVSLDVPVTTIGRRSDQTVLLDDERASRTHAEIRWGGDHHTLIDVGSSNGTRVNGERIVGPWQLAPGDLVSIGSTTMQFERD